VGDLVVDPVVDPVVASLVEPPVEASLVEDQVVADLLRLKPTLLQVVGPSAEPLDQKYPQTKILTLETVD
jgi:hypothetical protein